MTAPDAPEPTTAELLLELWRLPTVPEPVYPPPPGRLPVRRPGVALARLRRRRRWRYTRQLAGVLGLIAWGVVIILPELLRHG